jgi:chromosome segregation ATPase
VVSPSRVDDKARDTKRRDTIHAFGGGGFDVSALVESGRNERARRTDLKIRAAVRDVEAKHAEESAKRDAELADARERAESAESALAVLAADTSDASDAESSPARRRAAIDAASANLERYREEARVANEARAALAADRETLLEMLGEKTETCDSLETSLRLATERLERRDATDALRVSRPVSHNRGGRSRMTRDEKRPSRRDAYVATLTHAVFVARGGSELEPADD